MLDTIVLSLNQTEFEMTDMTKFNPSPQGLFQPPYYALGARGNFSCYQNPTKSELAAGKYKPRLTLTKRKAHAGYAITLRCEFSAPKLLYGNNFSELQDADFARLLDVLQVTLAGMGIRVKKQTLKKVQVSAIHYSKNIPLTDYSTCAMILGELGKINLTRRLDLSKTDYRNGGHAIRYHSNSYELAFYDKIKDMQQAKTSEKRAIEKDYVIQQELFAKVSIRQPLDVLRMELRIGNRTKLKSLMKAVGVICPMNFESLFSQTIAQKMLLHFWNKISQDMPILALSHFKPEDIYHALMMETKGKAKPAKLLQQIGALAVINNVGMRGLHSLVSSHSNARTWQRMKKEMEGTDLPLRMKYAAVSNVQRCLEGFEPLRLSDYADKKMAGVDMTLFRGTDATNQHYR
jgi:hypothetical protein